MKHSHRAAAGALVGVLLLLYGSGAVVVSRFTEVDTHLVWWAQVLAVLAGGACLLGWSVYSLPRPSPDPVSVPVGPSNPEDLTVVNPSSDLDYELIEAIHLLSRRMRESDHQPGLELCRQIHDHLFAVEYKLASDLNDAKNREV
jgi:hypothetical protein